MQSITPELIKRLLDSDIAQYRGLAKYFTNESNKAKSQADVLGHFAKSNPYFKEFTEIEMTCKTYSELLLEQLLV